MERTLHMRMTVPNGLVGGLWAGPWALLALALLPAGWAHAGKGLTTGGAHHVVVTSTPYSGLEEGIPRDSWYAKGVALDMKQRWRESLDAFRKAKDEFRAQLKNRPQWAKVIRGWVLKADFQVDQSRRLRYRSRYRLRHPSFYQAAAKHNKWLAIRAFTGQDMVKLRREFMDDYRRILQRYSYDESPRVALSAMLHELGRHDEAKREFAKLRRPQRLRLAQLIAYYYTAAGDYDKAFHQLRRAMRYSSSTRRRVLRSNDFDRLRGDPRFTEIVGAP